MLIAYIYDLADNVTTQLLKISGFSSRQLLNDIGTATFDVDPRELGVTYANLKEFTRVRVAVVQ